MKAKVKHLEQKILGAFLTDGYNSFSKVVSIIKSRYFRIASHGKVYDAMLSLYAKSKPIDLLTVEQEMKSRGDGVPFVLKEILDNVTSTANVEYNARIMAQGYIRKELVSFCSSTIRLSYGEINVDTREDFLDAIEHRLFEIDNEIASKEPRLIREQLDSFLAVLKERSTVKNTGIRSGYDELDKRMGGGWMGGELSVIAARPGMGKSALLLSMARYQAKMRIPIAIFSLEMSSIQLGNRLIAMEGKLDQTNMRKPKWLSENWDAVMKAGVTVSEFPIYVNDKAELSIHNFKSELRRMIMRFDVKIAYVDYLQLMTAKGHANRELEISYISRKLKEIAKEFNIPIIALAQLSRAVENTASKKPTLAHLRSSGAIEQDADNIFFLFRPSYYGITEDENGAYVGDRTELIVGKFRDGLTGQPINLKFIPESTLFESYEDDFGEY